MPCHASDSVPPTGGRARLWAKAPASCHNTLLRVAATKEEKRLSSRNNTLKARNKVIEGTREGSRSRRSGYATNARQPPTPKKGKSRTRTIRTKNSRIETAAPPLFLLSLFLFPSAPSPSPPVSPDACRGGPRCR